MNNKKIITLILIIIILCVVIFGYIASNNNNSNDSNFSIYFFEAGKADCILISNKNKHIMIDTGEESLGEEILEYLNDNNINKLDYLIITHFDKDHVGSASKIIDNIDIDNVLQSNYPKESEYYTNYLNSLESKKITAQTISGDNSIKLGDLDIVVNGPSKIYDNNESNNSSLIVSIKYDNTSYLFMGDCQNLRIRDYLADHNDEYDFIKIPYHGNYQKRLEDLLETTNPKYAVITCSNSEPDILETTDLLEELNIDYYATRDGSITITTQGEEIIIEQ